ncbi:ergothioneine biosynthesis glutamate--cysteine ligase EgtA [Kribbella speibonae]|uniref:ergothioneine biosynthesis glutamate--cysteine ligase EgtA n=1 Tax=Kribbella speibonae TaxID=1572660 RepID=UPI0013F4090C|nr:ergothioneine biosynthesis glutamate--cysteine ligase EgtA [Kribbella speibonae]
MTTPHELIRATPAEHARPLSLPAACEQVWRSALTDSTVGRVGLELENHVVDLDNAARPVRWEMLDPLPLDVRAAAGQSLLSREPGGQLELSAPPHETSTAAITSLRHDLDRVREAVRTVGAGLAQVGTDPLRPSYRTNPSSRYRAMEEHFTALGQDDLGGVAMNSTAALQINLDAGPARLWAERVAQAHRLGPVLLAISANSPWLHGRVTGWKSARQRTWFGLDQRRTGPVVGPRELGTCGDPAMAWAQFALRAPVMIVATGQGGRCAVRHDVTFEQWVRGEIQLDGRLPTAVDLELHLTTLFPPVRLRGYLELRYLDATPQPWWPAVVAVAVTLMDDPVAADIASEAAERIESQWTLAARDGLADQRISAVARRCLQIAADRVPLELAADVSRLADLVESGRSPGDLLAERIGKLGPRAAFAELAGA